MKELVNFCNIEGFIFKVDITDEDNKPKMSKRGTEYFGGTIYVAQDKSATNVTRVNIPYVGKTTKNGEENKSFSFLKKVVEKGLTIEENGVENAAKCKIRCTLVGEEYYSAKNKDENGNLLVGKIDKLESFSVYPVDTLNEKIQQRNIFSVDCLIKDTQKIEATSENEQTKLILKTFIGKTDSDKNWLLMPMDLVVENPNGIAYFLGLGANPQNPIFTKITGTVRTTVTETVEAEQSEGGAFGEVVDVPVSAKRDIQRDFLVLDAKKEPYPTNTERTITFEEIKQLLDYREKVNSGKRVDTEKRIQERENNQGAGAFSNGNNYINEDLPFDSNELPPFDLGAM